MTLDECGKEYLINEQRLIVYRCLADSTWFLHEYHLAESYLKKALHSYKQIDKNTVDIYSLNSFMILKYIFRWNLIGLLNINIVNIYVY